MIPITNLFSYTVRYDIGFAPNPYFGYCSLGCCKPGIRKTASIGDLIVGTSSTAKKSLPMFLYIMRVSEIINFDDYWNDVRFKRKKPNLRGSTKQLYGDNIYHTDPDTGEWVQERSRHSNEDGSTHSKHLERDTRESKRVLLSNDFVYWGSNAIFIPSMFRSKESNCEIVKIGPGFKKNFSPDFIRSFEDWFNNLDKREVQGRPTDWPKP